MGGMDIEVSPEQGFIDTFESYLRTNMCNANDGVNAVTVNSTPEFKSWFYSQCPLIERVLGIRLDVFPDSGIHANAIFNTYAVTYVAYVRMCQDARLNPIAFSFP